MLHGISFERPQPVQGQPLIPRAELNFKTENVEVYGCTFEVPEHEGCCLVKWLGVEFKCGVLALAV